MQGYEEENGEGYIDIDDLYHRSFQALDWVYRFEFKKSIDYKRLK